MVLQGQSLHMLQKVIDGVILRCANSKPWIWVWKVADLVSPGRWDLPPAR